MSTLLNPGQPTPQPTTEPTPAPVPNPAPSITFPDNWKEAIEEDLRNDPSFSHIKDIQGLAKSYVHAQRMMGADKITLPSKHDDGSELRGILHKLGLPSEKDKYELKFEAKEESDKELLNSFKEKAFELGVLPGQAQALFEAVHKSVAGIEDKSLEIFNAQRISEQEELKKEWGQGYDANINLAIKAIKHLSGEDQELYEYMVSDDLGGDPKFVKLMSKVGHMLKEDNIISDGNNKWGKTPEEAQREIDSVMGNQAHPYNNSSHPAHQQALMDMQKLFEMTLQK